MFLCCEVGFPKSLYRHLSSRGEGREVDALQPSETQGDPVDGKFMLGAQANRKSPRTVRGCEGGVGNKTILIVIFKKVAHDDEVPVTVSRERVNLLPR
jgi:hypothetical protein